MNFKSKKSRDKGDRSQSLPTPEDATKLKAPAESRILGRLRRPFQRSATTLPGLMKTLQVVEAKPSLDEGEVVNDPLSLIPLSNDGNPNDQSESITFVFEPERNFWQEAVESLAAEDEYKHLPPEMWKFVEYDGPKLLLFVVEEKNKHLKRQWRMKIAGKEVNLKDLFTKTVDWVQRFTQLGEAAEEFDPRLATLPWAGFRLLFQAAVDNIELYGSLLEGLERISWLISYASTHEFLFRIYYQDNPRRMAAGSEFVDSLGALYTAVLKYLYDVYTYYDRSQLEQVALDTVEIDAWLIDLRKTAEDGEIRLISCAKLLFNEEDINYLALIEILSTFSDSMAQNGQVDEKQSRLTSNGYKIFLRWISGISYADHHEGCAAEILPNTGEWLLSDAAFLSWIKSGSVLWLHGMPGSGKTKSTAIVIDYLMKRDKYQRVAYFYCANDSAQQERAEPEEIFRSILRQLISFIPEDSYNPAINLFKARKEEAEKREEALRSPTLNECVDLILQLTSENPATIVIDALDECRRDKRDELLKALDRILQRPDNSTRVFITCRDDVGIVLRLGGHQNIFIRTTKNTSDIGVFIHNRVDRAIRDRKLLNGEVEPSLKALIIRELQQGAQGMFIWVTLQISALCDPGQMTTADAVIRRLQRLPSDIYDLYAEVYERTKVNFLDFLVIKTALTWLLYGKQQLPIGDLLFSISLSAPSMNTSKEMILDICHNLVDFDKRSNSFTLAHASVRDFLAQHEDFHSPAAHATIAKVCFEVFTAKARNPSQLDQLLKYASLYWPIHYKHSIDDGTPDEDVLEAAYKFISSREPKGSLERWAYWGQEAKDLLPPTSDLRLQLEDASFEPLSTICAFGIVDLLECCLPDGGRTLSFETIESSLITAVRWRNEQIACLLLEKVAKFAGGMINLHIIFVGAIESGMADIATAAMKQESKLHAGGDGRWMLLHWMVLFKSISGMVYLLENDSRCNDKDADGRTPLHLAAISGNQEELLLLLDKGAKFDIADKFGWTAWHWAAFMQQEDIKAKLSDFGTGDNLDAKQASFLSHLDVSRVNP